MSRPTINETCLKCHNLLVKEGISRGDWSLPYDVSQKQKAARAFRKWSLRNHPDKGGDVSKFQETSDCTDITAKSKICDYYTSPPKPTGPYQAWTPKSSSKNKNHYSDPDDYYVEQDNIKYGPREDISSYFQTLKDWWVVEASGPYPPFTQAQKRAIIRKYKDEGGPIAESKLNRALLDTCSETAWADQFRGIHGYQGTSEYYERQSHLIYRDLNKHCGHSILILNEYGLVDTNPPYSNLKKIEIMKKYRAAGSPSTDLYLNRALELICSKRAFCDTQAKPYYKAIFSDYYVEQDNINYGPRRDEASYAKTLYNWYLIPRDHPGPPFSQEQKRKIIDKYARGLNVYPNVLNIRDPDLNRALLDTCSKIAWADYFRKSPSPVKKPKKSKVSSKKTSSKKVPPKKTPPKTRTTKKRSTETVAELRKMCKDKGIKGYSRWNKEELIKKCKNTSSPKRKTSPPKRKTPSPPKKKPAKTRTTKKRSTETVAELRKMCKDKGIKGYSKWKKEELIKKCKNTSSPKNKTSPPKRRRTPSPKKSEQAKTRTTKKRSTETVVELRKMCKDKGIKGYSKWNKEELIKKCKNTSSPKRKTSPPKRKTPPKKTVKKSSTKKVPQKPKKTYTIKMLHQLCKSKGIKGYRKLSLPELLEVCGVI